MGSNVLSCSTISTPNNSIYIGSPSTSGDRSGNIRSLSTTTSQLDYFNNPQLATYTNAANLLNK